MERMYKNLRPNKRTLVKAFFGIELEHTPAFGHPTLFVVGRSTIKNITEWVDQCPVGPKHIYFGANQSFDGLEMPKWIECIKHFLTEGFWCSLAFKASYTFMVSNSDLCGHARFIPVVSVRAPCVTRLGPNAQLKIDDIGFGATNPGIWVASLASLRIDEQHFTSWIKYEREDVVIETVVKR